MQIYVDADACPEHVRNAVLTPVMTFITHLGDAGRSR